MASDNDIQRRIGGLEALVSSNRDAIHEVKRSIKDLQDTSVETQKLILSSSESVKGAIDKFELVEQSLHANEEKSISKTDALEARLDHVENLLSKLTGGLVVLICLLNAPWEWLLKLIRALNQ